MYGLDMASVDRNVVDWREVRASGRTFAFIRATNGTAVDPSFATFWPEIRAARLVRGAYHALRYDQPAGVQAEMFLDTVRLEPGDLPPMLDLEVIDIPPPPVADAAKRWLAIVEHELSRRHGMALKPFIYTSARVWRLLGNPCGFEAHPLWVVDRTRFDAPRIPATWGDDQWTIQQYAGDARGLPGISRHADLDRFRAQTLGDRGRSTLELKTRLAAAGFTPHSTTDEFDTPTRDAVMLFQAACSLVQDGLVGPKTFAALQWGRPC
jgi:lysozyme